MKSRISFIVAVIILGGIIWSFRYFRDMHPLGSMAARLDRNGMESAFMRFKGIRLIGKSEGKKLWSFTADSIDVSHDRQKATFNGKIIGKIALSDDTSAYIKTDRLVYGIYTHDISIPNAAEIGIANGPVLHVRDTLWHGQTGKLECRGGMTAKIADSVMNGKKMTADLNKKSIYVEKVSGAIKIGE